MKKLSTQTSRKIQILRGIAIIAVVLIHTTPHGLYQVLCRPFLNFCVGLFLFLSGLLSDADAWHPRRRMEKVLIPYALWTLVYVVPFHLQNPAAIPLEYLKRLVLADSAATMYYVFVYIQFTALLPWIGKAAKSRFRLLPFLIAPVEVVLFRLLPMAAGLSLPPLLTWLLSVSCLPWFTFFYLGYLLGSGQLTLKAGSRRLAVLILASILLQWLEGWGYYRMGNGNCGTQLKLSALLTTSLTLLLAYRFVTSSQTWDSPLLKSLGDHSFGIYFSHLAVMGALGNLPLYTGIAVYPINGVIVLFLTFLCCILGRRLLGRCSKYLAL